MPNIGYARVSSADQSLDVQLEQLQAAGCGKVFAEKLSGRSWSHSMAAEEPEFTVESVARSAPWLKKGAGQ